MTAKGPTLEEQIKLLDMVSRGFACGHDYEVIRAAAATLRSLAREQEQSQSDADSLPLGSALHPSAPASSASDPSPAQAGVETEWMLDRLCEGDPAYLVQVPRAVIRQLRDAQISNDRYAVNAQYDAERIAALEKDLAAARAVVEAAKEWLACDYTDENDKTWFATAAEYAIKRRNLREAIRALDAGEKR